MVNICLFKVICLIKNLVEKVVFLLYDVFNLEEVCEFGDVNKYFFLYIDKVEIDLDLVVFFYDLVVY